MDSSFVEDAAGLRRAMEYYADQGWTDGLPVVPVIESYLAEFLAQTDRDPGDVLLPMPQLNRACTVRLAAINAALAGCRPEYFPVVLAAWESLAAEGHDRRLARGQRSLAGTRWGRNDRGLPAQPHQADPPRHHLARK